MDLHPKVISQQNCVPVCAVVRREAWDDAGGFNPAMRDGCEDWELWAHIAELGYVGKAIPEYLFHYRFSLSSGRDVSSRNRIDEIRQRIMRLHPRLGDSPQPKRIGPWRADGDLRLRSQPWTMPSSERRPVVFFLPNLALENSVEAFVQELASGLVAQGRTVVIISTQPVVTADPAESAERTARFQAITPFTYDLSIYLSKDLWLAFIRSILWRLHLPVIVNVGSSWLYENLPDVRAATRGPGKVVEVLSDNLGNVPASVASGAMIDERVVGHVSLKRLLVDYYQVPGRVTTVPVGEAATMVGKYSAILG
jgi:hypothetical protein